MEKVFGLHNNKSNYLIPCKMYLPETDFDEIFIICHGFASWKDSRSVTIIVQKLLQLNIASVVFDFPQHGSSTAKPEYLTVPNCLYDLSVVEKYVRDRFQSAKVSLFGISFGGYLILKKLLIEKDNYYHIILRAPALDMKDIVERCLVKGNMGKFKNDLIINAGFEGKIKLPYEFYQNVSNNDVVDACTLDRDILIIQGKNDNAALINLAYRFVKNNKKIKLIEMQNVDHVMSPEEIEQVACHMSNYLQKRRK